MQTKETIIIQSFMLYVLFTRLCVSFNAFFSTMNLLYE